MPIGTYLREVLNNAYLREVLNRRYEVAYSLGKHLVREFLVSINRRRLASKSYLR